MKHAKSWVLLLTGRSFQQECLNAKAKPKLYINDSSIPAPQDGKDEARPSEKLRGARRVLFTFLVLRIRCCGRSRSGESRHTGASRLGSQAFWAGKVSEGLRLNLQDDSPGDIRLRKHSTCSRIWHVEGVNKGWQASCGGPCGCRVLYNIAGCGASTGCRSSGNLWRWSQSAHFRAKTPESCRSLQVVSHTCHSQRTFRIWLSS